jgi:hypothetical protein
MRHRKASYLTLLIACAAFAMACERKDPTGPTESSAPAFSEHQGGDN